MDATQRVARKGQTVMADIVERIRGSPVVHADETGWREDGHNGYVWTFSAPTQRYFLRRNRGKTVVDEVLGAEFAGVLVSDFYAAYHHYDGPKQRCWAHLLRDIHDLRALYPDDAPLARWADAVHGIYDRAKACTPPQAKRRRSAQLALERQLLALGQPFRHDPSATQAKLCRRIERHIRKLFVFVAEPDVRASGQQRRRAQPAPPGHQSQDQRRHPLGARHTEQDDAGIPLRRLARPGSKSARRLPSTAHFPATLNCYLQQPQLSLYAELGVHRSLVG